MGDYLPSFTDQNLHEFKAFDSEHFARPGNGTAADLWARKTGGLCRGRAEISAVASLGLRLDAVRHDLVLMEFKPGTNL